jgi:hypothetical protein
MIWQYGSEVTNTTVSLSNNSIVISPMGIPIGLFAVLRRDKGMLCLIKVIHVHNCNANSRIYMDSFHMRRSAPNVIGLGDCTSQRIPVSSSLRVERPMGLGEYRARGFRPLEALSEG